MLKLIAECVVAICVAVLVAYVASRKWTVKLVDDDE